MSKARLKVILFSVFAILVVPRFLFAGVYINEVMYNPPGADTGREWVEVCNDSNKQVQITTYKFADSGYNHKIVIASGVDSIPAKSCAILSNNPDKFKQDYPNSPTILFKSSFSLNNSGEKLELKLNDYIIDKIEYKTDFANGDGLSLHRSGNSFLPGLPSPGDLKFVPRSTSTNQINDNVYTDNNTQQNIVTNIPLYKFKTVEIEPPQDIYIRFKDKIVAHVDEYINFDFEAYNSLGKSIKTRKTVFFGDGKFSKYKFEHFYRFPGTYTALLRAEIDNLFDEKKVEINIYDTNIELIKERGKGELKIKNKSKYDIDLYNWRLFCSSQFVDLPHTIIKANSHASLFLNDFFYSCNDKDDIYIKSPTSQFFYAKYSLGIGNNESNNIDKGAKNNLLPTFSVSTSEGKWPAKIIERRSDTKVHNKNTATLQTFQMHEHSGQKHNRSLLKKQASKYELNTATQSAKDKQELQKEFVANESTMRFEAAKTGIIGLSTAELIRTNIGNLNGLAISKEDNLGADKYKNTWIDSTYSTYSSSSVLPLAYLGALRDADFSNLNNSLFYIFLFMIISGTFVLYTGFKVMFFNFTDDEVIGNADDDINDFYDWDIEFKEFK